MYFAGIDIGKHHHEALVLDGQGDPGVDSMSFSNTRTGIKALIKELESFDENIRVALESSGPYWLCLYDRLTSRGYDVVVINPLQTNAYRKAGIRKAKTDPFDAFWIADLLHINRARPNQIPEAIRLQLRELSRFRFSLVDRIGKLKRKVISVLDRIFPEYEALLSSAFLARSRRLLQEASSAQEFARFDFSELTELLRESSRGRFKETKAWEIIDQAKSSIGISFLADAAQLETQYLLEQIHFLEERIKQIDDHLLLLLDKADQYLTTIPGIGVVLAATILGEIGDVNRFPELENLVAYAGIDPTIHRSGQFEAAEAHMSKQGSPYLRRALWLATNVTRQHDPDLKAYYQKKKKEGKHHNTVIGSLCRKLLARIYVILKEERPYVVR